MPDADSSSLLMQYTVKAMIHLKEYSIPVAIGIGYLLWKLLRWLGLGFIDDVKDLKNKSTYYATKDELADCHKEVAKHIDKHFETLSKDIKDVHGRVDDIHKTILIGRVATWDKNKHE